MTRRDTQYLQYDSLNRLTCAGSAQGVCDINQFSYDIEGHRLAEIGTGGGLRFFIGDYFEWDTGSNTAEAHVFAFGQRIATQVSTNASLRAAWIPVSWPLPIGRTPFFWGLGIVVSAALLAWLTQLGAIAMVIERPATAAVALLMMTSIATPAYAGGGGDSDWIRRWYHGDHLGSSTVVTNELGDVIHRRVFEPFGMVIAETASPTETTSQLYTGQKLDAKSGLYDFKARWYDPVIGRFASIDPVLPDVRDPQTHNPFSYVRNNPVNFVDPDGRDGGLLLTIILTAVLSTALENYVSSLALNAAVQGSGPSGRGNPQQQRNRWRSTRSERSGGRKPLVQFAMNGASNTTFDDSGGDESNSREEVEPSSQGGMPPNVRKVDEDLTERINRAEEQIREAEEAIAANLDEIGRLSDYISSIDEQILGRPVVTGIAEGIVRGATHGESSYIEQLQSGQRMARKQIGVLESENIRARGFITRRRNDVAFYTERRRTLRKFFKSQR